MLGNLGSVFSGFKNEIRLDMQNDQWLSESIYKIPRMYTKLLCPQQKQ